MKKLITLLIFLFIMIETGFSQIPNAINFQAIARDSKGNIIASKLIQVRLSVIDSAQSGVIVYQEIRSLTTNSFGSFSFQIGVNPNIISVGTFNNIDWQTGNKHLKIDFDSTNSLNWSLSLGIIRFVTVPYAFSAGSVTNISSTSALAGNVLKWNATSKKWEAGSDLDNQTLSLTKNVLSITNGNFVNLPYVVNSSVCDTSNKGSLHYNASTKKMEYCDGTNWIPVYSNTTTHASPTSAMKGQKLTVTFSGASDVTFSQSSPCCPLLYTSVRLFYSASPTSIYPHGILYIDPKTLEAVFDIPAYVPSGFYDIILGDGTLCPYTISKAFKIN